MNWNKMIFVPENIKSLMQALLDGGHEAYVVGGAIRDRMMYHTPDDWDLFTDASGDEILSIFPSGKVIGGTERQQKILTVVVDGVEISQYRTNMERSETGQSLEQHLATCDFTINAMACDIHETIIDPHDGQWDLNGRNLRCVGDPLERIYEDKLRALRAIRFVVKYKMSVEGNLATVLSHTDISDLPVERVRDEMLKIFKYSDGMNRFVHIFSSVIPELADIRYMDGGQHHEEPVCQHLCLAQSVACCLTDNPILIFACGLHDIGKAKSFQRKPDGGISFHKHESVGADMITDIMKRLKFSNADIKYVSTMIAEHMFGPWSENITNRAFVKHFGRLDAANIAIEDYMILLYADNQANIANPRVKFGDFIRGNLLHKKYYELKFSSMPFSIRDLAINGNDLIDIGMPAGPRIGEMLRRIFDSVIIGNLENERADIMYYINHFED